MWWVTRTTTDAMAVIWSCMAAELCSEILSAGSGAVTDRGLGTQSWAGGTRDERRIAATDRELGVVDLAGAVRRRAVPGRPGQVPEPADLLAEVPGAGVPAPHPHEPAGVHAPGRGHRDRGGAGG